MHLADCVGLKQLVERLDHYAVVRGNPYGYWNVSPLLRDLAASGRAISQYASHAPS